MHRCLSNPKLSGPINLFANQAFNRCGNGRILSFEPIEQVHLVRREFKIDLLGLLSLILRACPFLRLGCCHGEPSFLFCLFGLFEAWAFSGVSPVYLPCVLSYALHYNRRQSGDVPGVLCTLLQGMEGFRAVLWYEGDEQTCS